MVDIVVKHKFVSEVPDSPDETVVRPSNWNDTHDVEVVGLGDVAGLDKADAADIRQFTTDKVLVADNLRTASSFVTIPEAELNSFNWQAGVNFRTTIANSNQTLSTPTNPAIGTWRLLRVSQGPGGGRTLAWSSAYRFPNKEVPTIPAEPNATSVFSIFCAASAVFYVFPALDMGAP